MAPPNTTLASKCRVKLVSPTMAGHSSSVFLIDESGQEIDISSITRSVKVELDVGDVNRVTLTLSSGVELDVIGALYLGAP